MALVRCESYEDAEARTAVRRAVDELGGISRFIHPGDRVLLKPNLLAAYRPEKRVTTDPAVVKAVASLVIDAGGRPVIGDSPAIGSFKKICAQTGMSDIASELDLNLVELSRPMEITPPATARFKKLEIASQVLEADVVINLPKLKTHGQMLLTLGVKNLFGTVVAQRKALWHHMAGVNRDVFASLLLDIYLSIKPALTIMDGVWGMEGHGPSNGSPRRLNLIAAAEDAVAMDITICGLLGAPLRSFPLYRAAKAREIGQTDPARIILKGDPLSWFSVDDFALPALGRMAMLPARLDWFTKRFLVSKPVSLSDNCLGCGQCAAICPEDAVEVLKNPARVRFDYHKCIRCYCCQEICPQNAIAFRQGLLVKFLNMTSR